MKYLFFLPDSFCTVSPNAQPKKAVTLSRHAQCFCTPPLIAIRSVRLSPLQIQFRYGHFCHSLLSALCKCSYHHHTNQVDNVVHFCACFRFQLQLPTLITFSALIEGSRLLQHPRFSFFTFQEQTNLLIYTFCLIVRTQCMFVSSLTDCNSIQFDYELVGTRQRQHHRLAINCALPINYNHTLIIRLIRSLFFGWRSNLMCQVLVAARGRT